MVYKQNTLIDFIKWYKKGGEEKEKKKHDFTTTLMSRCTKKGCSIDLHRQSQEQMAISALIDLINIHYTQAEYIDSFFFVAFIILMFLLWFFKIVLMENKVDIIGGDIWSSSTLLGLFMIFKYIYGLKKEL